MKSRRGQTGGRKCDVAVQRQPLGSVNATVRGATDRNGETADPQNNSGQHIKWKHIRHADGPLFGHHSYSVGLSPGPTAASAGGETNGKWLPNKTLLMVVDA